MSKQTPMLMESPLTKRVFVVTSYKDKGDGIFEARQKYDVTEQFDALAEQRSGTCENISDPPEGFLCSECGWGDFAEPSHLLTTAKFTDNDRGPNYCPNCGRRVER